MANIRLTKEVAFDIDNDLRVIKTMRDSGLAPLPNAAINEDEPVRIYIFDPIGNPLIIFDGLSHSDFLCSCKAAPLIEPEWSNFPCLNLAAFAGTTCFFINRITVKALVFICIELAKYAVINPCDPDGSFHDALMTVIERHRNKSQEGDSL